MAVFGRANRAEADQRIGFIFRPDQQQFPILHRTGQQRRVIEVVVRRQRGRLRPCFRRAVPSRPDDFHLGGHRFQFRFGKVRISHPLPNGDGVSVPVKGHLRIELSACVGLNAGRLRPVGSIEVSPGDIRELKVLGLAVVRDVKQHQFVSAPGQRGGGVRKRIFHQRKISLRESYFAFATRRIQFRPVLRLEFSPNRPERFECAHPIPVGFGSRVF
jgi:hypothetical protein